MNDLDIDFDATQFIRDREGFRLKAYPDPVSGGKPYTIAWGLTGSWVKPGLVITEKEAETRFMQTIDEFCNQIAPLLTVELTKNQRIAILSFTYNLGIGALKKSTLLKKTNNNDKTAANEFLKWDYADGRKIPNLTKRRQLEKALFLS
jgi:lysozyme